MLSEAKDLLSSVLSLAREQILRCAQNDSRLRSGKMSMRGLISLSLAGLAGCYTYQPIEPAAAPLGAEVRARINGAASDRVAPLVGSFDNRVLVGNVVENTNGVMTLEVPTGAMANVAASVVRLHARVPIMP